MIAGSGVIQVACLYLTMLMWPSLIDRGGSILATLIPQPRRPSPPKLHDNSFGSDNEEHFAGLRYKKCSIMTNNSHTIRTSPGTCCERLPCFVNQRLRMGARIACAGYAVSGEGKCPRRGSACPDNEEILQGVCYRKCSLLTNDSYPHRFGPALCCKAGSVSCLYVWRTHIEQESKKEDTECFEDEEMMLGACYKKCGLAANTHPDRLGPVTCCGTRLEFQTQNVTSNGSKDTSSSNDESPIEQGGVWHMGCFDFQNMTSNSSAHVGQHLF